MKTPAFLFIALAMSASAFSQTSVPAAPTLTAGAEFKGLRFDWDTVPGATWYQLEYRAHQTGAYVQVADDFPATATSTHFSFPVHLYDWTYARYRLAACNDAGCSRSAAISVSNLRRDAVGYFKAGVSRKGALFGEFIDLSPDGYNLAATAPGEVTSTGTATVGGGVYVFRRGSDGNWVQRVRLDANAHGRADVPTFVDLTVAISGSGNTVAVGSSDYFQHGTTNWDGEVDVFSFRNGAWTRTRIPRPEVAFFGGVQLNENGDTLAAYASTAGNDVAIYKLVNGVWQNVYNTNLDHAKEYCEAWKLSRDGHTLALQCGHVDEHEQTTDNFLRVLSGSNWSVRTDIALPAGYGHNALALDRTGNTIASYFFKETQFEPVTEGFVRVYQRDGSGYRQVAQLNPGSWTPDTKRSTFGDYLAMSGDGHTLIVGDTRDAGAGLGPRAAPLVAGTEESGAAYVYRLTDSWKLVNVIKPNYYTSAQRGEFPRGIKVSQSGKTVVIGVSTEDSSAKGIDGNWANSSLTNSGAVFMY
jgi:hypothetical protein